MILKIESICLIKYCKIFNYRGLDELFHDIFFNYLYEPQSTCAGIHLLNFNIKQINWRILVFLIVLFIWLNIRQKCLKPLEFNLLIWLLVLVEHLNHEGHFTIVNKLILSLTHPRKALSNLAHTRSRMRFFLICF